MALTSEMKDYIEKLQNDPSMNFVTKPHVVVDVNLDYEYLKYKFEKDGYVQINNFMNLLYADMVYNYLNADDGKVDWHYSIRYDVAKPISTKVPEEIEFYSKLAREAFAEKPEVLTYKFRRTVQTHATNCTCMECNYIKFFRSGFMMAILKRITGMDIRKGNEMFSSYYAPSDYLSKHSDKNNGSVAFVYNVTKNWQIQYGGNLHLLNSDWETLYHMLPCTFNNLVIFKIPKPSGIPHYVSHVAPLIKEKRLAVTGWYE